MTMKAPCARNSREILKLNRTREDTENAIKDSTKGLEEEWQRRHSNCKDYIETKLKAFGHLDLKHLIWPGFDFLEGRTPPTVGNIIEPRNDSGDEMNHKDHEDEQNVEPHAVDGNNNRRRSNGTA